MLKANPNQYFDFAQLAIWVFWGFFAYLIYYLQRESHREGYPLHTDRGHGVSTQGTASMPPSKTYLLPHGGTKTVPVLEAPAAVANARQVEHWPGSPIEPTGNPLLAGVGPGSYTDRLDVPDLTHDGRLRIVPMRTDAGYYLETRDPDPRGMTVYGFDGASGGVVRDIWVDRAEAIIRYLEVEVGGRGGADAGGRRVLLPMNFARVNKGGFVGVKSITGGQFADVPALKNPGQVTRREEDRICAYYGAGTLYATPSRKEPLL
jgi:photosynthetic reaction center H subunit